MTIPLRIPVSADSVKYGFFDAATPPVAEIDPGDEVVLETISGSVGNLPDLPGFEILPEHRPALAGAERGEGTHIVTGPVGVRGARPGDVLVVDIREIALRQNWGWSKILPLYGTLPSDFPDPVTHYMPIDIAARTVALPWGGTLGLRPFFGVMGVAPPPAWGRITTIIPRAHGGNLDNKELVPGTTLYLPVFVDGGRFSVGDGHGVQGDGEVCVTALETALTGRFRLGVRRDMALSAPRAESPDWWMTMGFGETLDDALRTALRDMIAWLGDLRGLKPDEAYVFCSLAGDFRVTQTVNVHKGVHCILAKRHLS